jgi:hypothetical protein
MAFIYAETCSRIDNKMLCLRSCLSNLSRKLATVRLWQTLFIFTAGRASNRTLQGQELYGCSCVPHGLEVSVTTPTICKRIHKADYETCSSEKQRSFLSSHQHSIELTTPSLLPCSLLSVVEVLGESIWILYFGMWRSVVWYNCTDFAEELPPSMIGQRRERWEWSAGGGNRFLGNLD